MFANRIWSLMVAIIVSLAAKDPAWGQPDGSGLEIDKYHFSWTVADSGDAAFKVVKDENGTRAVLSSGSVSLSMLVEDAELVADALSRTEEFAKKFTGSKSQSEKIDAGSYSVTFSTSKDGSFYVAVSQADSRVFGASVLFGKADAKIIAKGLKKVRAAAQLVDSKVKI
jgi:hypothetical protein